MSDECNVQTGIACFGNSPMLSELQGVLGAHKGSFFVEVQYLARDRFEGPQL